MRLIVPHPVIKDHHVKHTATFMTLSGTLLEVFHYIYPSGLILIALGACAAIYEPYIVHDVKEPEPAE